MTCAFLPVIKKTTFDFSKVFKNDLAVANCDRSGVFSLMGIKPYDFCIKFGPGCKLIRGGAYNENAKGAIARNSVLYHEMAAAGFKWGGEIKARQKDFMHFSIDGM
jgi:hypothetical protein